LHVSEPLICIHGSPDVVCYTGNMYPSAIACAIATMSDVFADFGLLVTVLCVCTMSLADSGSRQDM